jgi:hypothetical protein
MAASLKIINNFALVANGITAFSKQGDADDDITDPYTVPVDGKHHRVNGVLLPQTSKAVWASSEDYPDTFVYVFIWATEDLHLQIFYTDETTDSVVMKIKAKVPFVLSVNGIIATGESAINPEDPPSLPTISAILLASAHATNTCQFVVDVIR